MIDFKNGVLKQKPVSINEGVNTIAPMMVEDEEVIAAFKSIRDKLIFTNKRVVVVNVQGVSGKKTDYTSLPYSKINAFSVETAGTFDRDCEIELWLSAIGRVKLELKGNFDIKTFNRVISKYVL